MKTKYFYTKRSRLELDGYASLKKLTHHLDEAGGTKIGMTVKNICFPW